MMQKMMDFVERSRFISSTPGISVTDPGSSSLSPAVQIDSSSESSTASSPLSPSTVEEEMMIRAATSGGGSVGLLPGGSRSSPFPFPAIMSVSPDPKTPSQFLLGLGMQIIEGRLPDHKQAKGFWEGDHCQSLFKSVSHFCDYETNPMCRQLASLQFLLMSDPSNLTLEVVLTPSKHAVAANHSSVSAGGVVPPVPEMLLEKWRVSLVQQEECEAGGDKPGGPPITMSPRNLHNAVRSFLHFSQLAAWLSKKKEFTSVWKVRIDMGDSGGGTASTEGWDRHEFPAVTLESPTFWESSSNIQYGTQRGWNKNPRCNTKWTLKVSVDSLPRMANFPLLPLVAFNPGLTSAPPLADTVGSSRGGTNSTNSITTTTSTTTTKPCLSSQHHNHSTNKSQQMIYSGADGENEGKSGGEGEMEAGSGVRIRFRGGRSRRSHASGGNNGSSSHRSRPKNLRIAIPDVSQSSEEDADVTSYESSGVNNGQFTRTTAAIIEKMTSMTVNKEMLSVRGSHHQYNPQRQPNINKIPPNRESLEFDRLKRETSQIFNKSSSRPLVFSPAPVRRSCLGRSSSPGGQIDPRFGKLNKGKGGGFASHHFYGQRLSEPSQSLLGSFEESVLHGRIEPVSTVDGFTVEVNLGSAQNFKLPSTVCFYTFCDNDRVSSPYSAHVTLSPTVYTVPRQGTVQVTLYNPLRTVVKTFVINYDLSSLAANSQTFIRQKIFLMPLGESDKSPNARKWLRYLIHLRFGSSPTGDKVYLHKDIRMIVLQKADVDTAIAMSTSQGGCQDKIPGDESNVTHEFRSFTYFADGATGK